MSNVVNFSAGPSILPQEAMESASKACLEFGGLGLSLLEISHRSKPFVQVMDEAVALVKEVLAVPKSHEVVFLQGGASTQFCMAPFNFLPQNKKAAYIDTGAWSKKAIKEAKILGEVEVIASSSDRNYCYIPKAFEVPKDAAYLHFTSNNTIFGTQFQSFPKAEVPLIADMSSDIFSRPIDFSGFDLVYAGAQKNLGPAGATLAIVRQDALGKSGRAIPSMLDYAPHIKAESMFNTPPCFSVFVCLQTLKWLKAKGGAGKMEELATAKADLIYGELDKNPLFKPTADSDSRSKMNVTFVMESEALEKEFLAYCEKQELSGLKGHRSVGGFRASIYNAMEIAGVKRLVSAMADFAQSKA